MTKMIEDELEQVAIDWFKELDYEYYYGPDIAPDTQNPLREDYKDVFLTTKLRESLERINKHIPREVIGEAIKKIKNPKTHSIIQNNKQFHQYITDGIDVEYKRKDGSIKGEKVYIFDLNNINNNTFTVVNQFTIIENANRRPDMIVFINGIPLVLFELKNPTDENADIYKAFNQIQTYKKEIPSIFNYNSFTIISDGISARAGTITANFNRFMQWKSIDGEKIAPQFEQLETQIKGMFEKNRFLDIITHFILFQENKKKTIKILGAYHQFFAVNKAIEKTRTATSSKGDKKIGVVWHTTGSGKSLTALFYAGKVVLELDNPTIMVLTDRNDLDNQLFNTFSHSPELLRQIPKQATSRDKLKELLKVNSGGVIFTTIQKFLPEKEQLNFPKLSDRRNIVVISDESHRTNYGLVDGFAKHMRDALPNASFIGFTGTPIEGTNVNTRAVFGDYIDIYDMTQSINDGATVKIFYECRLAKIGLKNDLIPKIENELEIITEEQELSEKQRTKAKWAQLEAIIGAKERLKLVAKDILTHFEKRKNDVGGKAIIVGISRRVCVDLYDEIVKLKPNWHSNDDTKGKIKIIMSGSASDIEKFQPHIRNKKGKEDLATRMKNPDDELEIVIVRDMWLTGFDAPCINTMYIDKPMKGHSLIQAISRVNRIFEGKTAGLIIDYIGIGDFLKKALMIYTNKDKENVGIPTEEAISLMVEKHQILKDILHGYDYSKYFKAITKDRLKIIANGMEHVLNQKDGKKRFIQFTTELLKSHSLCASSDEALKIANEIEYFKAIKSQLIKLDRNVNENTNPHNLDIKISEIVSKAIKSDGVVDIFAVAGIDKPNISILSDDFLEEVKNMKQKNLALELLQKLLNDEIKIRLNKNKVQEKKFAEMLKQSILKYQNRTLETVKIIEELIELGKQIREYPDKKIKELGLSQDEIAFYDALGAKQEVKEVMDENVLKDIAKELVIAIRKNKTVDWSIRDSARAKMRLEIKKLLKKYRYPPEEQEDALKLVMEQAERSCEYLEPVQRDYTNSLISNQPMAGVAETKAKYHKNK